MKKNWPNDLVYITTELEGKTKFLIIKLGLFYNKFHQFKIYQFKIHQFKIHQFKIHQFKNHQFKIYQFKIYQLKFILLTKPVRLSLEYLHCSK